MTTTAQAWAALVTAMETDTPSCDGWPQFTAERVSEKDAAWMREVCRTCPVVEACSGYAAAARPSAGWWAGRQRTGRT